MTDYIIKRIRSIDFTGDRILHASHVTEVVWNAADEIERLRRERDEARREVCEMLERDAGFAAHQQAESRGWDCFEEATQ